MREIRRFKKKLMGAEKEKQISQNKLKMKKKKKKNKRKFKKLKNVINLIKEVEK
jgi:hypothetical protein